MPYSYLLSTKPSGIALTVARASNKLTERQLMLLYLRLGAHFKRIHEEVQNDWFGLASQEKDELYSWEAAFANQFHNVLSEAQQLGEESLPYLEIRKCLSRAIGSFLFDDCEVPSLVSFLGHEESIFVDFNPESPTQDDEIPITSILSLSHALWGDPLMEMVFVSPDEAFLEGYGGSPIVFPRQDTKRLFYTLFRALVVLVQTYKLEGKASDTTRDWARGMVIECTRGLENAPYS